MFLLDVAGRVVLESLGISVDCYYASEVDEDGIMVSRVHYPGIMHVGDVNKLTDTEVSLAHKSTKGIKRIDPFINHHQPL